MCFTEKKIFKHDEQKRVVVFLRVRVVVETNS